LGANTRGCTEFAHAAPDAQTITTAAAVDNNTERCIFRPMLKSGPFKPAGSRAAHFAFVMNGSHPE
jgi:hypothetical protein